MAVKYDPILDKLREDDTGSGSGDMSASTYDPQAIAGDAFDQDNMTDGTTNKNYTATEKTKLAGIADGAEVNTVDSVNLQTGAVSLDADDIDDTSTAHKFVTASDITNLGNLSGTNTGDQDISGKLDANTPIVGATKTKITYDADGLVTAGEDATQDDIGDGTTYKQYSSTEKTKLSNIEASADVTDAVNVGSSIHGATAKTTPVDADTMPLIDSAASNVLKKVTWANIKSVLTTAFNALYAPIAKGVTNGDSHDHSGGDGAQIDHGGLAGLSDDDHTQYILADGSRQLVGTWEIGSDSLRKYIEIPLAIGDVSRYATVTIDIVVAATARIFDINVALTLARSNSVAAWGYAIGNITFQHPTSSGGTGVILGSDLKSDASGSANVSVTEITDGIRFSFGGGDFTNTCNANMGLVRISGWGSGSFVVTSSH